MCFNCWVSRLSWLRASGIIFVGVYQGCRLWCDVCHLPRRLPRTSPFSYARLLIESHLAQILNENLSEFMRCQRQMMPLMVTSFLNLIASTFMFWLFISYLDYGYIGASMSLTVSNLLQMLLNFFAAKISIKYPTWPQYSLRDACDPAGALELLRLSLPGALTVWSEWWAWVIPSHKI